MRSRISTQLYVGVGTIVALTVAASAVAWYSFGRVDEEQSQVNERSVPEMVAAFGVAQLTAELSAAGPRISAAPPENFDQVSAGVDETFEAFDAQLAELAEFGVAAEDQQRLEELSDSLISNVALMRWDRIGLFELIDRRVALQGDLEQIRIDFDQVLLPAIDDQFFYTMTGLRGLSGLSAAPARYRSDAELNRYRHLAELQANANLATQLLASAFVVGEEASLEPLRENFESVQGRVERSLVAFTGTSVRDELAEVFERLFNLGGIEDSFDLRAAELRLLVRQEELLAQNREFAVDLVALVDSLVGTAETNVQESTAASEAAINTGQTLLTVISAAGLIGAGLIVWRVRRVLVLRLARVSMWMRRLAKGDLESTEEITGRDEVADMAAAIDVFRLSMLEVQRLNLVEMLADELKEKNEQLEEVLADLNKAQDQIVMREKLAALGELTAGVAHEIKNPLNFVKNFSEVSEELLEELNEVLTEVGENVDEENRSLIEELSGDLTSNLERIRSHGERANRIVQDMLQMGRDTGEKRSEDLNRLLDEHARLAYHAARANDPDFQLDLKFDLDPEVGSMEVTPRDLSRVFVNLVSNAGDATDQKHRELRAARERGERLDESYHPVVWLSSRRLEDRIEISVKDNGHGIPDDVADKIFNPFFTTKPTDRGTGLGLAISNDIVREHGGRIRVESVPGESTTMTIELPTSPLVDLAAEAQPVAT